MFPNYLNQNKTNVSYIVLVKVMTENSVRNFDSSFTGKQKYLNIKSLGTLLLEVH